MIFIYLQALQIDKKILVPFRITAGLHSEDREVSAFTFKPEIAISPKTCKANRVNREALLTSPPFCDIADELIDLFLGHSLVFMEGSQFYLLKHQFKIIGYNFNIKPTYLLQAKKYKNHRSTISSGTQKIDQDVNGAEFSKNMVVQMAQKFYTGSQRLQDYKATWGQTLQFDLSTYKMAPGVYFFLNEFDVVLYVGKAKNIRKRLQSHFSGDAKGSNIKYSAITRIRVDYTGNDIIAQLIESVQIKSLQPIYNTQQVINPKPYRIDQGKTATGIIKLAITRKITDDHLAERYFNRNSVKAALTSFCGDFDLCRKHCALERKKGPCTNVTIDHKKCVCNGGESIETYNKRFQIARYQFENTKNRKLYKLKGRTIGEDAFVYVVNDIYEGYCYIDRDERVLNVNDILGHLVPQENNYDTSRILSSLDKLVHPDHIIFLNF